MKQSFSFLLLVFLNVVCFGQNKLVVKTLNDSVFNAGDIIHPPIILFMLDRYDLNHPSRPIDSIKVIADFMKKNKNITIEVGCHTDYRTSAYYSQKLSFPRAKTIVRALIDSFGINPERLVPAGYSESKPRYLEKAVTTPSGKTITAGTVLSEKWIDVNFPKTKNKDDYEFVMQMNRRTELRILRKDFVPKVIFTLKGTITNKETKNTIPGAVVRLVGSDNTSIEIITDSAGNYFFDWMKINPNTAYVISAKAFPDVPGLEGTHWAGGTKAKITTQGLTESFEFREDFVLQPPKPIIHFPQIIFGMRSAKLSKGARDSLEYLYKIMIENPAFIIELTGNCDGYEKDRIKIKRARKAMRYLTKKGIARDRLMATEIESTEQTSSPDAPAKNIIITILRRDYVPKEK